MNIADMAIIQQAKQDVNNIDVVVINTKPWIKSGGYAIIEAEKINKGAVI